MSTQIKEGEKKTKPTAAKARWICGKCEQDAGKYPDGERLAEHFRLCPKRKEDLTEGIITLKKLNKGYVIHIAQPLGFSSELALTEKELLALERLIKKNK